MKNRNRIKWLYLLMLFLGIAIIAILLYILPGRFRLHHTEFLDEAEVVSLNPLTGFAPPAENRADCAGTRLVTITLTWAEWEPQEGQFDIAGLEEKYHIREYREKHSNAVLRFVCDVPGDIPHMDIPQWLYDRTADGVFYDTEEGKGYAPDYSNRELRTAHRKALKALGDYFNDDSFLAYVEAGSLGANGEWHTEQDTPKLPNAKVLAEYVRDYREAFHNVSFVALGGEETEKQADKIWKDTPHGVYFDALGDKKQAGKWLKANPPDEDPDEDKIAQPVAGRLTPKLLDEERLSDGLQETLQEIRDCHITYLSGNCPNADMQEENSSRMMLRTMGSCIYVSKLRTTVNYRRDTLVMEFTFQNIGVAPFPQKWPVKMLIYDSKGKQIEEQELDLDIRKVAADDERTVTGEIPYSSQLNKGYSVGVSVCEPNGDNYIELAQKGVSPNEDGVYLIYEYKPVRTNRDEEVSQPSSYEVAIIDLIADLSVYAKEQNPNFAMVTNGGYGLYQPDSPVSEDSRVKLTSSIDGALVESVFYGWNNQMNRATPEATTKEMLSALGYARASGVLPMNMEYCNRKEIQTQAAQKSKKVRTVWFNANTRDLKKIPPLVEQRVNRKNVTRLSQIRNFMALLDTDDFKSRNDYLSQLQETDYDLIFIDLFFQNEPLTKKEVDSLKKKKNGGKRMVCAYMSIGEAETYRDYWQASWYRDPPVWICDVNEDWKDNYKVMYWLKPWRDILFGSDNSYLDRILKADFDGVYLDVVDAYEYFVK